MATLADLKIELADYSNNHPDIVANATRFIKFAQKTLESKFLIPSMETTVSGTLALDVNAIPIPSNYLNLMYIQFVNGDTYRMLSKFSELEYAEWGLHKRISVKWTQSTVMPLGYYIIPTAGGSLAYEVTTSGTSGTVEPTWPTSSGATVTADGVTYTAVTKLNTGFPNSFDRIGTNWIVNVPADAAYLYNIRYHASLAELSGDNDTNWWTLNAEELLLHGAMLKAKAYLGDDPRMPVWEETYRTLEREFRTALGRERYSGDTVRYSTPLNVYR